MSLHHDRVLYLWYLKIGALEFLEVLIIQNMGLYSIACSAGVFYRSHMLSMSFFGCLAAILNF